MLALHLAEAECTSRRSSTTLTSCLARPPPEGCGCSAPRRPRPSRSLLGRRRSTTQRTSMRFTGTLPALRFPRRFRRSGAPRSRGRSLSLSRLGRPKPPPNRSPKRAAGTPDESLSNSDFVPGSCAEAPRLRRSHAEAPLRPRPRPCVRNHDDTQLAATVSQGPRPAATDRHANRSRRASGAADRQRRPQKLSRLGEARIRGRSIESPRHRSARAPSRSSEPHAPIAAANAAETAPTLLPYRESFECALRPPTEMGVDSAHREPNATEAAVGLPLPRRRSARASRARPHTKMRDRDDASETRRLGPTDPRVDQLPRSRTTKVARSRGEPA